MNRIVAGIIVAVACLAGCDDSQRNSYATFADARESGAIDRGWVPTFLPQDATQIEEFHSVESDQSSVKFLARTDEFLRNLSKIGADLKGQAAIEFDGARHFNVPRAATVTYFYACDEDGLGILAADSASKSFYYLAPVQGPTWDSVCAK